MEVLEPNEGLLPRERDRGEVEDIEKEVGIGMGSKFFAVFGIVVAGDVAGCGKTLRWRVLLLCFIVESSELFCWLCHF
jgi:hypothetical protein